MMAGRAPITRRAALVGCALIVTAGCTASPQQPAPSQPAPSPTTTPFAGDISTEVALVRLYDSAARTNPDLAATLRPIRAEHAAHLAALRAAAGGRGTSRPSATAGAHGNPARDPGSPTATLDALRTAEVAAAHRHLAACLAARGADAALLGSIVASETSHVVALSGDPTVLQPVAPGRAASTRADPAQLSGLQSVLAAQYELRWGYDIVGGQAPAALQPTVREVQAAHLAVVRLLQATIRARHAVPGDPQAAYALPFTVADGAGALRLAAELESRSTTSWHYLLDVATDTAMRRFAADGLCNAAVRATQWRSRSGRASTVTLPGT